MDLSTRQGRREQGARLQQAVERAGLSIEELANRIGCSRALIYQYVSGSTLAQPDRLQQIAVACGVDLSYFYSEAEPELPDASVQRPGRGEAPAAPGTTALDQANESTRLADTLRNLQELARAQESPPNYRTYASTCERILFLSEQQGDRAIQAEAQLNLGNAYNNIGDNPRAADALRRAVALSVEIGNSANETSARQSLGKALLLMGQTIEAQEQFQRIAYGADFHGRWKGLVSLGSIHERQGEYRLAMERFDEAAAILEDETAGQQANPGEIAIGLLYVNTNRRNVYLSGGDFSAAHLLAERGIAEAEALGNADQNLEARFDLGWCDYCTGRWAESYQGLTTMLQFARFVGDQGRETIARAGLGILLAAAGDHDASIAYGKDALAMALSRGDRRSELYAQLALADAYMGNPQRLNEARYHINQALAISMTIRYARTEIECQLRLARLLALSQDVAELAATANRALTTAQSLGTRHLESLARIWLSEALCRSLTVDSDSDSQPLEQQAGVPRSVLAQARQEAIMALELAQETGLAEAKWRAQSSLAQIAQAESDELAEEGHLRAAVGVMEALRNNLLAAGIPDSLLENGENADIYERLARLLAQTGRREEARAFLDQTGWPPLIDRQIVNEDESEARAQE